MSWIEDIKRGWCDCMCRVVKVGDKIEFWNGEQKLKTLDLRTLIAIHSVTKNETVIKIDRDFKRYDALFERIGEKEFIFITFDDGEKMVVEILP